jgi:HEAT repeat protein
MELPPDQLAAFVAAIDHPDEFRQRDELKRLGIIPGQVRVDQFLTLLSHPSRDVRKFIIVRLCEPELRGESYPAIEAALQDESAVVRIHAASILRYSPKIRNRPAEEQFIALLLTALSDEDMFARFQAARFLISRGESSRLYLPQLLALADDPHEYVRLQAVRATYVVGAPIEMAGPVLGRLASDPSPVVRSSVQNARKRLELGTQEAEPGAAPNPAT